MDVFAGPAQVSVQCRERAGTVTAEGCTDDVRSRPADGSWLTGVCFRGPARLPDVPTC
ncbi:hypothetical protein QQY24_05070 [Streptomyces sp. TG1A-8]|uniref:hypothetical protein n=1 Tax=Streptomyces sp. TG1A-8 TaxID=3051385 RepID=UPI00265B93E0|nr:hypothetical protein [Streptomyces sp. TG1A-8]MDO0924817.1 hypothetical protein [Streptomyces sp. TG1A-8]